MSIEHEQDVIFRLDEIRSILKRIEERQIKTTGMVQEMEKQEQTQTMGSFATTNHGEKDG